MLALSSKWPQLGCGSFKRNKICLINFLVFSFLILGLFINPQKSFAQSIASYVFTASNGTYTTLTGATSPGLTGGDDDGYSNNIDIGFSFYLGGAAYTKFNVSTNGFITLGNATFSTSSFSNNQQGLVNNNGLTTPIKKPIIAPLWDDLSLTASTTKFSYLTTGVAPNRVLTMEWSNVLWDKSSGSIPVVSFQVKLFETSNIIMFIYDNLTGGVGTSSLGASVGFAGPATGAGNFLSVNQLSTSATVSSTSETYNILGKPQSGLTFTFTPRKSWVGSGAGGPGTDFNAAINWSPAIAPVAGDDLFMNINSFTTNSTPFATLSASTTISSLTINLVASGLTQRTFSLNTGSNNFTISNKLSLENSSSGNPGHTLNFNIQGGTASTGDLTALVSNGTNCSINFNNSGITSINGTTRANSKIGSGSVQFNLDNSPAKITFNGEAYFDDGNPTSVGVVSLGRVVGSNTPGDIVFNSNVTFGSHAKTTNGSLFGQTIFDGSGAQQQVISVNAALLYLPSVIVGNNNPSSVRLSGSGTVIVGTPTALSIKNNATLDLGNLTLNGYNASGTLSMAEGSKLRCGGTSGGVNVSNFPKFSLYSLDANSTVSYYDNDLNNPQDQTIASIYLTKGIVYGNLHLEGASTKKLDYNASVTGLLEIDGSAKLDLSENTLTVNGGFAGQGLIIASADNAAAAVIEAKGMGTLYFDPAKNYLKRLTINPGGNISLGNALNIAAGMEGNWGLVGVDLGGVLNSNGFLTLKSSWDATAVVSQSKGIITGEVTVERHIPASRAWRFIGVPFASSSQTINQAWQEGATPNPDIYTQNNPKPGYGTQITFWHGGQSSGFDENTTANPSIRNWDPATSAWASDIVSTYSNILSTPAYYFFIRGDRSINLAQGSSAPATATILRARGVLNETGSDVIYSPGTTYQAGQRIFLTNPYAATIDLQKVLTRIPDNDNIVNGRFWVWNPNDKAMPYPYNVGNYVTYDLGLHVPNGDPHLEGIYLGGNNLQSGQAFMLEMRNTGIPSITFKQEDKVNSQAIVFGPEENLLLSLPQAAIYTNLLTDVGDKKALLDGVAAGFGRKFSVAVDVDDAVKMWNQNESMALRRNDTLLSIEMRPTPRVTDTLFYKLYLYQKSYTLQIFADNLPDTVSADAYLVDKYFNTQTLLNLHDTSLYNFTANADTNSYRNRFMLVFSKSTGSSMAMAEGAESYSMKSNEKIEDDISLYPNPVSTGQTKLQFTNLMKGFYDVSIYTMEGVKLSHKTIDHDGKNTAYTLLVNEQWPAGVYIVRITNQKDKKTVSVKLIINRNK